MEWIKKCWDYVKEMDSRDVGFLLMIAAVIGYPLYEGCQEKRSRENDPYRYLYEEEDR